MQFGSAVCERLQYAFRNLFQNFNKCSWLSNNKSVDSRNLNPSLETTVKIISVVSQNQQGTGAPESPDSRISSPSLNSWWKAQTDEESSPSGRQLKALSSECRLQKATRKLIWEPNEHFPRRRLWRQRSSYRNLWFRTEWSHVRSAQAFCIKQSPATLDTAIVAALSWRTQPEKRDS